MTSIQDDFLSSAVTTPVDLLAEPTLHSLGLAQATPPGLLQALMEQIHLQGDLPWWGTIMISTRFDVLKFLVQ